MKRNLFLLILIIISITAVQAQSTELVSDSIEYEKVFGGYRFYQQYEYGYEPKNFSQLRLIMEDNQEAYVLAKKASTNATIANVLGFAGGVLVGAPLGAAIVGGEPNWTLAAIGGGLIVAAIPISSGANKKMVQAVDIYNNALQSDLHRSSHELEIVFTSYGAGLSLRF
ncbi:hypothetical protein AB9P05_20600 [Roseivirga sp. BDSF3-8]|uniref:hypothetical protein n=1 Tax=Roseivirga sp. BDSF3-8 TaxID=3241598 RepID=UPI0035322583